MRIAVPKEIMNNENRVALTPSGAQTLVQDGHEVLIETGAGEGASFPDSEYEAARKRVLRYSYMVDVISYTHKETM